MAAKTPLLDLSTLIERETIRIDAKPYEIRSANELSIFDQRRLADQAKRVGTLLTDKPADDDGEAHRLLDAICKTILIAPVHIHEKLSDTQRLAICEVFLPLLLPRRAGTGAQAEPATPPIGASSSPDSSGSMAEAPMNGSIVSRSPSSTLAS